MRRIREVRLELSAMVFSAGLVMSVLAIVDLFFRASSPQVIVDIVRGIGNWMVWVAFLGPILGLIGGFYFVDTLRKRREFNKLINTTSKAKFVRNQDRLEYLAWILSSEHERKVWEKKQEFNIKP